MASLTLMCWTQVSVGALQLLHSAMDVLLPEPPLLATGNDVAPPPFCPTALPPPLLPLWDAASGAFCSPLGGLLSALLTSSLAHESPASRQAAMLALLRLAYLPELGVRGLLEVLSYRCAHAYVMPDTT